MLGLAQNIALWGKEGMDTGCWWGNLKERDYLQNTYVDRTVTLKQMGGHGHVSCGQVLMAGFEQGNEPSESLHHCNFSTR
jgi:hypothetical protein